MGLTRCAAKRMIPPMNSLTVYALGDELNGLLRGARIATILAFRGGVSFRLEDAGVPFLHLLHHRRDRALFPGKDQIVGIDQCRECLRAAHGARITSVRALGTDRILLVELERSGDWHDGSSLLLRVDFLPFDSPASLYSGDRSRLIESVGSGRSKTAASPEKRPPQKEYSILSLPPDPPDDLTRAVLGDVRPDTTERSTPIRRAKRASEWIVESIGGVDPLTAKWISRSGAGEPKTIWGSLLTVGSRVRGEEWSWHLYTIEGDRGRTLFPFPMPFDAPSTRFPDAHSALEAAAYEDYMPSYIEALRREVAKTGARDIKRLERLHRNIESDIEQAERSKEMRHFGNLLVTYRHLMKTGLEKLSVKDFSGERTVTIPLDPAKQPDENIRLYFRRARKGERGLLLLRDRRRAVRQKIEERKMLVERGKMATDPDELLQMLPPLPHGGGRTGKEEPKRFRSFDLDNRHTVLVGRNDRENDLLTHRVAAPGDLWFHAQGSPGSHVILKGATPSTPKRLIETAAAVAAFFSKARHSNTVPVICAEKRYVRKPRKSKPGTAVCQRSKTIFVKPRLPNTGAEGR